MTVPQLLVMVQRVDTEAALRLAQTDLEVKPLPDFFVG